MADPDPSVSSDPEGEDALTLTPYDAFFKAVLGQLEYLAPLLRSRLPAKMAAPIRWNTGRLHSTSFVSHSLAKKYSDILVSFEAGEREVLMYVLLEHQTTVDKLMPLRFYWYQGAVWSQWVADHPGEELPLPFVIPFLIHQGPAGWEISAQFADLFDLTGEFEPFAPYVPHFQHLWLDLSKINPSGEEKDPMLRLILEFMKRIREDKVLECFNWMAGQLMDKPIPVELLRLMLICAWNVDTSLDVEAIARSVEANPKLQGTVMTTYQKILADGEAKGRADGEAKGRADGEAKGEARGLIKGEARGLIIGKIQMIEGLLELSVSALESFSGQDTQALEKRFEQLEKLYKTRFKSPS